MPASSDQKKAATLRHAILHEARPNGSTWQYFETEAEWEGELRARFWTLRREFAEAGVLPLADARALLRMVNGRYGTRYALAYIDHIPSRLRRILDAAGWHKPLPPLLRTRNCVAFAEVVSTLMAQLQEIGAKRPYSLLTKFLHFLFPETFVIYDAQVARSIAAVGLNGHVTKAHLQDCSGRGYATILTFYQQLWNDDEHRAAGMKAIARLSNLLTKCSSPAPISLLDLTDKLLWHANGDLKLLGF